MGCKEAATDANGEGVHYYFKERGKDYLCWANSAKPSYKWFTERKVYRIALAFIEVFMSTVHIQDLINQYMLNKDSDYFLEISFRDKENKKSGTTDEEMANKVITADCP